MPGSIFPAVCQEVGPRFRWVSIPIRTVPSRAGNLHMPSSSPSVNTGATPQQPPARARRSPGRDHIQPFSEYYSPHGAREHLRTHRLLVAGAGPGEAAGSSLGCRSPKCGTRQETHLSQRRLPAFFRNVFPKRDPLQGWLPAFPLRSCDRSFRAACGARTFADIGPPARDPSACGDV